MRILKDAPVGKDRRRILLLSYHFPPAETAGALRWQKLAAPLSEAGWALDVVTLAFDPVTDSGLQALESLPSDTRVFGVPEGQLRTRRYSKSLSNRLKALRPARTYTVAPEGPAVAGLSRPGSLHRTEIGWHPLGQAVRRAYGAAFRLNLERGWAKAAERTAAGLLEDPGSRHEVVVTCGPPHLVHPAGFRLHRRFGLPFVMDTRDPWRFIERIPEAIASPVWLGVSRFLEERCVREAALVVTNTEPAAELLRRTYPGQGPFLAVRNGSDVVRPAEGTLQGPFTAVFAGSIYLDRDPRPLFEAAARLVSERNLGPEQFRILLVGNVSEFDGRPVRELADSAGVADFVELRAAVPRDELAGILAEAAVLVSLPQDSHLAIPSKIFEYAEYPASLLAISEPASATARLLAGTSADVVPPGSPDGIHAALARRYEQHRTGERPRPLAEDPRFRRSIQAALLVEALGAVAAPGQSPRTTSS
jgi:hypothetical protein